MVCPSIEIATVRAFILPTKRERYVTLLGNPKKRAKILDGFNHCHDFDARYVTVLSSIANLLEILQSHRAPDTCYVISDYRKIDGREMKMEDAINEAQVAGLGSLLCCLPGRLACYLGESGEKRLLLRRDG